MDTLPLDAIAYFLDAASRAKLLAGRPLFKGHSAPHLVFTASLEVDPPTLSAGEVRDLVGSWTAVAARAKQFSYNKNLDPYPQIQHNLPFLLEPTAPNPPPNKP